jgi:hypothetical protein
MFLLQVREIDCCAGFVLAVRVRVMKCWCFSWPVREGKGRVKMTAGVHLFMTERGGGRGAFEFREQELESLLVT